ncbi:hereditary spastic paraplegia protein strumpellin-domain-containing protein, partial [Baffinella frigidus]
DGVVTDDYVLDNTPKLLSTLRQCNVVLRWTMLHRNARSKKVCDVLSVGLSPDKLLQLLLSRSEHSSVPRRVRDVLSVGLSPDKLLRLLLKTAQLEFKLSELLKSLLATKQLEFKLSELLKALLATKQARWNAAKKECHERISELAMYFSGDQVLTRGTKDARLQAWFSNLAGEVEKLSHEDATVAGRKMQQLSAALQDVEEFHQVETNSHVKHFLQDARALLKQMTNSHVKHFLQDARALLKQMVRTVNVKEGMLVTLVAVSDLLPWDMSVRTVNVKEGVLVTLAAVRTVNVKEGMLVTLAAVSDLSFAFDIISDYVDLMHALIRTDPSSVDLMHALIRTDPSSVLLLRATFLKLCDIIFDDVDLMHALVRTDPSSVLLLRATFLKLASVLDLPLVRIMQAGSDDLSSVAEYYSSQLVAFVRQVLEVVPVNVFLILNDIIALQAKAQLEIPSKIDKATLAQYALLDDRYALAKATHQVSVFAEGVLAMERTLMGVVEVDPKQLLTEGICKELVRQITMSLHGILIFPTGKIADFERRLEEVRKNLDAFRRSFEYIS